MEDPKNPHHFQRINLMHTGKPMLSFSGKIIATASGKTRQEKGRDKDQSRFHCLTLYVTEGGQYVANINYKTLYPEECDHHSLWIRPILTEVVEKFTSYHPEKKVSYFGSDRKKVLIQLEERYQGLLSRLLSDIDFVTSIS